MTFDIDFAARRMAGVAFLAVACALAACGGGDEASHDSGTGVVAADQLPSVMSTVAGLPSEQDLGLAQSQSQSL